MKRIFQNQNMFQRDGGGWRGFESAPKLEFDRPEIFEEEPVAPLDLDGDGDATTDPVATTDPDPAGGVKERGRDGKSAFEYHDSTLEKIAVGNAHRIPELTAEMGPEEATSREERLPPYRPFNVPITRRDVPIMASSAGRTLNDTAITDQYANVTFDPVNGFVDPDGEITDDHVKGYAYDILARQETDGQRWALYSALTQPGMTNADRLSQIAAWEVDPSTMPREFETTRPDKAYKTYMSSSMDAMGVPREDKGEYLSALDSLGTRERELAAQAQDVDQLRAVLEGDSLAAMSDREALEAFKKDLVPEVQAEVDDLLKRDEEMDTHMRGVMETHKDPIARTAVFLDILDRDERGLLRDHEGNPYKLSKAEKKFIRDDIKKFDDESGFLAEMKKYEEWKSGFSDVATAATTGNFPAANSSYKSLMGTPSHFSDATLKDDAAVKKYDTRRKSQASSGRRAGDQFLTDTGKVREGADEFNKWAKLGEDGIDKVISLSDKLGSGISTRESINALIDKLPNIYKETTIPWIVKQIQDAHEERHAPKEGSAADKLAKAAEMGAARKRRQEERSGKAQTLSQFLQGKQADWQARKTQSDTNRQGNRDRDYGNEVSPYRTDVDFV